MMRRLNGALGSILPETVITISSSQHRRSLRLSPLSQLALGAAGIALLGWLAVGSAMTALSSIALDRAEAERALLAETYGARIDRLTRDRDIYRAEAGHRRARLSQAEDRLAAQQAELMANIAEGQDLQTALGLARAKLQEALDERDTAMAEREQLLRDLTVLSADLNSNEGSKNDISETVAALAGALQATATARDTARQERSALEADIAAMELQMQVTAERQDRMVAQLEEAVAISFTPLETLFESTGMDVNDLVTTIRRNYSGTGGPLIESNLSTRSFDNPELTRRFASLMEGMDRINVMRIAADKLPYAMPVTASHRFTSGFGMRRDPKTGGYRAHNGIDLAGSRGTPIYSTADGTVVFAGRQRGFGNLVKIRHEFGFETLYAHLHKIRVSVGDRVARGERIGDMGNTGRSTGTHLHYEVRIGGRPVNPMTYIKAARNVF